jgi:GDP-mannose 6-dehydrogenase
LRRAKEQDVDCPLLNAILPSNQGQIFRAIELVEKTHRSKIGILGFGATSESSGMYENPIVHLAEMLRGKGYRVRIFDESIQLPSATETNDPADGSAARQNIAKLVSTSLEETIQDCEVVILASRDSEIPNLSELLSDSHILIDLAGAARQLTRVPARKHASP